VNVIKHDAPNGHMSENVAAAGLPRDDKCIGLARIEADKDLFHAAHFFQILQNAVSHPRAGSPR
jgi:hypothetical protein